MVRKVIIDCDLGVDDVVVFCFVLFDLNLEVVVVMVVEGCVLVV